MNHYDTLGIDKSATAYEIKQAWRRKASDAHPDRGGDTTLMAAINKAYEVLGDAERRAHYDATGSDTPAATLEQKANQMILMVFKAVIDSGEEQNILARVEGMLGNGMRDLQGKQRTLQNRIAKVQSQRSRVRRTEGLNMFTALCDQQIVEADANLKAIEAELEAVELATRMLKDYECDTKVETPVYDRWSTATFTTS